MIATLGVMLGVGVWMVADWFRARRPTLATRIGPYLRAPGGGGALRQPQSLTPFPTLERLMGPVIRDVARMVARWGEPSGTLAGRLRRAGSGLTVDQFRAEQAVWGLLGAAGGTVAALMLAASRGAPPLTLLAMVASAALAGVTGRDWWLGRAVAARERRIVAQLPTLADLLALSVSAGEGALGALERVTSAARGELATELREALGAVRAGGSLTGALDDLAMRTGVPPLRRFAEGVATAVERGTPLAEVLRSQAQDVRAAQHRALMEEGGKKEIAMMVPVVFLILPVTVIFAVFPGIVTIQMGL